MAGVPGGLLGRGSSACLLLIRSISWVQISLLKGYNPELGSRSTFYLYSSVGNTFAFDVVQVTGSNFTSNASFIEALARASWFPRQ